MDEIYVCAVYASNVISFERKMGTSKCAIESCDPKGSSGDREY